MLLLASECHMCYILKQMFIFNTDTKIRKRFWQQYRQPGSMLKKKRNLIKMQCSLKINMISAPGLNILPEYPLCTLHKSLNCVNVNIMWRCMCNEGQFLASLCSQWVSFAIYWHVAMLVALKRMERADASSFYYFTGRMIWSRSSNSFLVVVSCFCVELLVMVTFRKSACCKYIGFNQKRDIE